MLRSVASTIIVLVFFLAGSGSSLTTAVLPGCYTVITADNGQYFVSCLNPCAGGCDYLLESTPTGRALTCGCAGATPLCCHVGLINHGGGTFEIAPLGACKAQASPCPDGNACGIHENYPDPEIVEWTPECHQE